MLTSFIKTNPLLAGAIGIVLIIAVIAFFSYLSRENAREEEGLRNQGAVTERANQLEETINAVQNAARPATDAERNFVCDRYNRNRQGCS